MTVLAGLLDDLDLSAQELAEAMREATARTSRDGVGPLTPATIEARRTW